MALEEHYGKFPYSLSNQELAERLETAGKQLAWLWIHLPATLKLTNKYIYILFV